jgi:hypothetical protein
MVTTFVTLVGALTIMYLLAGVVMFFRDKEGILFRGDTQQNPRWFTLLTAFLTWLPVRVLRKRKSQG